MPLEVRIIQDYIKKSTFDPVTHADQYYIMESSYARMAAKEIMERLSGIKTPIDVISEFIREMNKCSIETANAQSKYMYNIAKQTGMGILLLFL